MLIFRLINSTRESIPDVAAVYFVSPTDENIDRICQDMEDNLYERYYLNFVGTIPRDRLERLAERAIRSEVTQQISKVFDQSANFVCLEDDLFVLRHNDQETFSYYCKCLLTSELKRREIKRISSIYVQMIC